MCDQRLRSLLGIAFEPLSAPGHYENLSLGLVARQHVTRMPRLSEIEKDFQWHEEAHGAARLKKRVLSNDRPRGSMR